MKKIIYLLFALTIQFSYSQITINESFTEVELIRDQFIGNPNFPANTFTVTSGTSANSVNSVAYFYANGADIAFDEGLVLSTGSVMDIPGANTSQISGGSNTWFGDIDLELNTGIQNTLNASFISFNFVAQVPTISLDFILASEEYGAFECQFGDLFAFLLTDIDAGITKNIALVPGSLVPISVTNVRGGDNQPICPSANEAYFDRYNYITSNANANIASIPAEDSPINLNGQTTVFTIADHLTVGHNYRLKIVVADYLDPLFDTAIFIRNNSFGAFPVIDTEPEDIIVNDGDNNGFEMFDLTIFESQMLGAIDTSVYSFDFSYHLTEADARANTNAIANPTAFMNTTDVQNIYVRMQNTYTGTAITTNFRITIDANLLSTPELQLNDIVIYPNPVVDKLTIDTANIAINSIEVYNINGQRIQSDIENNNGMTIVDFSSLDNGIYFLQIHSDQGKIYKRIVK